MKRSAVDVVPTANAGHMNWRAYEPWKVLRGLQQILRITIQKLAWSNDRRLQEIREQPDRCWLLAADQEMIKRFDQRRLGGAAALAENR